MRCRWNIWDPWGREWNAEMTGEIWFMHLLSALHWTLTDCAHSSPCARDKYQPLSHQKSEQRSKVKPEQAQGSSVLCTEICHSKKVLDKNVTAWAEHVWNTVEQRKCQTELSGQKKHKETSGQLLLSLKRTRRDQFWGATVKPVGFFCLNSAEAVFQTQLSALHKVNITIPGHRGHELIQLVQVLLRHMDSLLNRTNQIHRKQVAGAAHTIITYCRRHLLSLNNTVHGQLLSCAHPAMLVTRSPNNKQDSEQEIWKLHKNDCPVSWVPHPSLCHRSTGRICINSCAFLLNPHHINGFITHQDEPPLRLPLCLWLWFVTAFILNNRFTDWIREYRKISHTICLEGIFHTLGLIQELVKRWQL